MNLLKSFLGSLMVIVQVHAVTFEVYNEDWDEFASSKTMFRCPAGSITITASGVCINSLTVDNFSVADTLANQVTINNLSVTDCIIPSLTSAGVIHNDATGLLSSSLIVDADLSSSAAISDSKLATLSTAGKVANSATTATNANTVSAIVARDASGNFSAGTITANLNGNATTATNATNFTGSLSGDVTGTQSGTVVSLVGGQTAANVATATILANTATSANTASTLVERNGSGGFSAGDISTTDAIISGNLVLTTNPSTSTAGNIMKGSNQFVHNAGTNNTFIGVSAGNFTTSGSGQNSALGKSALTANTTGANNTAIGFNALSACTTGNSNIAMGSGAGITLTTGSNNVYIAADAGSTSESGAIRIGTAGNQTSCFISSIGTVTLSLSATAVLINTSTGQLGVLVSSEKFKRNIKDMGTISNDVLQLRPVTFVYKDDEFNVEQFGLIAEEVDKIFPAIVVRDENGEPRSVQYHILPVLLLNEMKKQQIDIDTMRELIAHLYERLGSFAERLQMLENKA